MAAAARHHINSILPHHGRDNFPAEGAIMQEQERRKHPRISLRTELWIGQDGIFTRTDEVLRDLSVGGAYIASRQIHPVGSIISIRFRLSMATNLISCSALVRSTRPGDGFGVQFLDISRENVRLIERQVAGETSWSEIRF